LRINDTGRAAGGDIGGAAGGDIGGAAGGDIGGAAGGDIGGAAGGDIGRAAGDAGEPPGPSPRRGNPLNPWPAWTIFALKRGAVPGPANASLAGGGRS
jgi:hypothetical protein